MALPIPFDAPFSKTVGFGVADMICCGWWFITKNLRVKNWSGHSV